MALDGFISTPRQGAVGEQIKITRNDKDIDLANGDRLTVKEIREKENVAEGNGRRITLDAAQAMDASRSRPDQLYASYGVG